MKKTHPKQQSKGKGRRDRNHRGGQVVKYFWTAKVVILSEDNVLCSGKLMRPGLLNTDLVLLSSGVLQITQARVVFDHRSRSDKVSSRLLYNVSDHTLWGTILRRQGRPADDIMGLFHLQLM